MDFDDRRNVEDQEEINGVLDNGNPNNNTAIGNALKLLSSNIRYNFEKIRGRLHNQTAEINAANMMLQYQSKQLDEVTEKTNELEDRVDAAEIKEAKSLTKYIASLVGLGALGGTIIILQIINLVLNG